MWLLENLEFYVWFAVYFYWTALASLINGFSSLCSISPPRQGLCWPPYLKVHPLLALSNSPPWLILLWGTEHLGHTVCFTSLSCLSLAGLTGYLPWEVSILFPLVSSPWHIFNAHKIFHLGYLGSLLCLSAHVPGLPFLPSICPSSIHPSIL